MHSKVIRFERSGSRVLRWSAAGALSALGLLCSLSSAHAAVIDVSGGCTLADAITAANTDAVAGSCPAGSGADTIELEESSTITLTAAASSYNGATGLPVIESEITINGHGSTIERAASAADFRILAVDIGGNLTLTETTITGGVATGSQWGYESPTGGGIEVYYGQLSLSDCVITGNAAAYGGGIADGGSQLDISGSNISGNEGDGLFSIYSTVTVERSALTENDGTGFYGDGAFGSFSNSTISSNTGGGVVGYGGSFEIEASTITGNGGVGVFMLYHYAAAIESSIVAGNHGAGSGREVDIGHAWTEGYNVFGYHGDAGVWGFTPSATDIIPSGPLASVLEPELDMNGGVTPTHEIRFGGPADNGSAYCLPFGLLDQRGVWRPSEHCDIGALQMVEDPCGAAVPSFGCTVNGVPNRRCVGTSGDDVIVANGVGQAVLGLGGNDTLYSAPNGQTTLCGGAGNDTLFNTPGIFGAILSGGPGNDTIASGGPDDYLLGGTGTDQCSESTFARVLQGCE